MIIVRCAYQLKAFHAEALGTPALEYTLLSNASRLAQSKGLHLRTPPGTQNHLEDDTTRQALWWTLYSYEKHLAYRSGIPSVRSILSTVSPLADTFSNHHRLLMTTLSVAKCLPSRETTHQ